MAADASQKDSTPKPVWLKVRAPNCENYTKTSLMLGLGETDQEILQTLKDLRQIDCDVVTFGAQFISPRRVLHEGHC